MRGRSNASRRRGRRRGGTRAQLELNVKLRGRGGAGRGQGRKKTRFDYVEHRSRPWHDKDHPVHVSTKILAGLPSLRGRQLWRAVHQGFVWGCLFDGGRAGTRRSGRAVPPDERVVDPRTGRIDRDQSARASFRIVEYSVQGMHIHLVCEASDRQALARGIQGFKIRVARAINRILGRKGGVFKDRYHARTVTNPTQCRHTLAYVLNNQRHHAYDHMESYPPSRIDPCSSALLFDGWSTRQRLKPWAQAPPTDTAGMATVASPSTWLLRGGWKRGGGLIAPGAIPGTPKGAPPLPTW